MKLNFLYGLLIIITLSSATIYAAESGNQAGDEISKIMATFKEPEISTVIFQNPLLSAPTPANPPQALIAPNSAFKLSTNFAEKLQNLTPSTSTLSALAGLAAIMTYGGYRYNRAYVTPTPDVIDESLKFMTDLMSNPYSFYQQNMRETTVQEMFDKLEAQRLTMLRALGLTRSYLNTSAYMNSLISKKRAEIDGFFDQLIDIYYEIPAAKPVYPINTGAIGNLQINGAPIYYALLQAKNNYTPVLLDNLIEQICHDYEYLQTADNASLFQQILSAENYRVAQALIEFIRDPGKYKPLNTEKTGEIDRKQQQILNMKKTILSDLGLANSWANYFSFFTLSMEKQLYKKEFDILFHNLIESTKSLEVEWKDKEYTSNIRVPAEKCLASLLKRQPNSIKWRVVELYITTKKMPFDLSKIK